MRISLLLLLLLFMFAGCFTQPTKEERKWIYAGISLKNKKIWDLYGIDLDQAQEWRRFKFTIAKAMPWLTKSFVPKEAKAWRAFGLDASDAKAWVDIGIDHIAYPNWKALNIDIDEVRAWKRLDMPYYAVALLKQLKFTPKRAKTYFSQEFKSYPRVYREYNSLIYNFSKTCHKLLDQKQFTIAGIQQQCIPYQKQVAKNKIFGHILDMKNDTKSLKIYINQLRDMKFTKDEIERNIEVKIDQSIQNRDIKAFYFLFPLLDTLPTKKEISFIDKNHLDFNDNKRYQSYEDIDYWIAKAKREHQIQIALEHQKKRRRAAEEKKRKMDIIIAKERRQKALQKAKRLKYEKTERLALAQCGPALSPETEENEKVQIYGKVAFIVGEKGQSVFGYGIQSLHNSGVYYIRDPKARVKLSFEHPMRLIVRKLRRLAGLKVSKARGRALFAPKSDNLYDMAIYLKPCIIKEQEELTH